MAELRAAAPVSAMPRVPARRWGDLWARAVMLTQDRAATPAPELVSGRLLPLGLEVHEHPTAVRLRLHALLKPTAGAARLLHTGVVLPKVDTIVGPAVWPLARDTPLLLAAIVEHRAVEVVEWPLSAGGHLTWQEDRAELGEPADPFVTARVELPSALAPATAALERHPVAIAEPVLLEGYEAEATAFVFGDHRLAVDVDRLPPAGPLTAPVVAASRACIGLLCWDGGVWSMRPLAVETLVKRKTVATHNSDWALGIKDPKAAKSNAAGADAVPVLRERAGRLLRR